tara:strand:- start:443 stop:1402 length:960 start_codon:yes stop_codon:yes gene_type:complete
VDDFASLIDSIRLNVNRYLKKIPIPDAPRYLYDPIRYSIQNEGKRFRPILTHLSGRANNIDSDALMSLSLAVELLHNFTLVHDDIMDNDTIRHGKQTIHEKWDSSTAILAGDGIYTIAQIILNEIPSNGVLLSKYFNKTTLEICEGQALDKEFENNHDVHREMYFDMINKKTGSLLGASAALPIIHNGGSKELVSIYEQFGRNLGMGFQIHDDLLEITGDTETMGKSLGSDIFEGKQTIMVILARESYPDEWRDLLNISDTNELIKNIYTFFEAKNIIQETRSISDSYFKASLNYLKKIDGISTEELKQLVNLIEKRTY